MNLQIRLVAIADNGPEQVHEIASLQRTELQLETLGLTLAEGKTILREIQRVLVERQVAECLAISGWNAKVAAQITVPTLVIRGDLDTAVPLSDIQDLLGDLVAVPQKVFVHVACASHYLVWENQHMALLNASVEWLQQGTYAGQFNGSFAVNTGGQVHQER